MKVSNGYARLLAASRLALLCIVIAASGSALAKEDVEEFLELGRLLERWAAENGHAGRMEGAILAMAKNENKRCEDHSSPTPNACEALTKALSVVTRVKKHGDSAWRCSEYLDGSKHVDDGYIPHWLIEGGDDIGMFNLSNKASGYIEGGWGKVAIDFYRRGSQAPFETFEFTRSDEQSWGDLTHHAAFGAEMSAKLNRALAMGATSVTTSFDTSGEPIKTVETSLIGYTRIMKLCGFQ